MARVKLHNLSKNYGSRTGVRSIDLETRDREFMVIFGPAGAGKTTTLNMIAGIVNPTRGSVFIGDRCVDRIEPADRNVAMVFESYALYPHMTVYDNIAFPLRSPRFKTPEGEIRRRVGLLADMMGIGNLLDRRIQALSNGQRQRTALGRALVRDPDVFLLDEPLSHLDAKLRHSMRAELKEMRGEMNTTTFYVTHDYLEALSLGDRITVLSDGKVLQCGSPDKVYFFPATAEVASLFGDPEVNLLQARLERCLDGGRGVRIFAGQESVPLSDELACRLGEDGHPWTVGVRPADIKLRDTTALVRFSGKVYSFEPLGIHSVVTIDVGEGAPLIRALVNGMERLVPDQTVEFSVSPEAFVFFDPETLRFHARSAEGVKGVLSRG